MQGENDRPEQARISYWCPQCQRGPAPAPMTRADKAAAPSGYRRYVP
jgi:hypothetical protein